MTDESNGRLDSRVHSICAASFSPGRNSCMAFLLLAPDECCRWNCSRSCCWPQSSLIDKPCFWLQATKTSRAGSCSSISAISHLLHLLSLRFQPTSPGRCSSSFSNPAAPGCLFLDAVSNQKETANQNSNLIFNRGGVTCPLTFVFFPFWTTFSLNSLVE